MKFGFYYYLYCCCLIVMLWKWESLLLFSYNHLLYIHLFFFSHKLVDSVWTLILITMKSFLWTCAATFAAFRCENSWIYWLCVYIVNGNIFEKIRRSSLLFTLLSIWFLWELWKVEFLFSIQDPKRNQKNEAQRLNSKIYPGNLLISLKHY